MKINFIFFLKITACTGVILLLIFSCKKHEKITKVTTDAVSFNADSAFVTAKGTILELGDNPVIDHGFCWSTSVSPSILDAKLSKGKADQTGEFTGIVWDLLGNTIYSFRAYAINENETFYGDVKSVEIPNFLKAVPNPINIYADSGTTGLILRANVEWSVKVNDNWLSVEPQAGPKSDTLIIHYTANEVFDPRTGTFNINNSEMGSLNVAIHQAGMIPTYATVTIGTITNLTTTSLMIEGNLINAGNSAVTQHGHCLSTSPNPTINGDTTALGPMSLPGTFTSSFTGLTKGQKYYIRAYAINFAGNAYSLTDSITTLSDLPVVITSSPGNITQTTAKSGGNVISDGGSFVTERGVCWSISHNPLISGNKTIDGSGTGIFTSNISGLNHATLYYLRAYATNTNGTQYGNEDSCKTLPERPTVYTSNVTNIAQTTALGGGNVVSDGGGPVTARGVCWSILPHPTLADAHTFDGGGLGMFTSNLNGLIPNKQYYIRAYATNTGGTAYGEDEKTFTTAAITLPTVTTADVTNILQTTAISGGDVTADGGSPVTAKGICWSTNPNPTTSNYTFPNGNGLGSFISYITGVTAGTPYYVRAFATNSAGTAYGNQKTFTTLENGVPCLNQDTVVYGGQVYHTVQIETQCWLKENLNIGTMIQGTIQQINNGIIEKYCYNNDQMNCNIYGGLYLWDEMMQYDTIPGIKGLCPWGWHLPTNNEVNVLIMYLGGSGVAGGKLKETGTTYWNSPNTGANNESGFSALPAGQNWYSGITFVDLHTNAYIQTSSSCSSFEIKNIRLYYNADDVDYYCWGYRSTAYSVRCIKN